MLTGRLNAMNGFVSVLVRRIMSYPLSPLQTMLFLPALFPPQSVILVS